MDIHSWLKGLGLEQYASAFEANAIDVDFLPKLTSDDLKEIGVAALAHRKMILEGIEKLKGAGSQLLPSLPGGATPTRPDRPREAERRQLTVMFVDLVGSTALATRLDPEDMQDLLKQFQNAAAGEVLRFEGHVAKFMGDGMLAYFGWPQAHEDEPERAVRAALATVKAVNALPLGSGTKLAVRIGVATGLVVVGDLVGSGSAQEHAVVGETPNLAARLQSLADQGGVVISEMTYRLVGNLFEVERITPQRLPGFDVPIAAYKVVGEGIAESRFEAFQASDAPPLCGRELDLSLLMERWRLSASGEGQVVEIFGEPGIGKSRLLNEFRDRLSNEPHIRLRYYCSPYYVGSALYPITDQLMRAGRIKRTDPPEEQLACLGQLIAGSTANLDEDLPLFASLLSIPTQGRYKPLDLTPQKQRSRTFEVLIRQVEVLSRSAPVVMMLEDAHYLDSTSSDLFDQVVDRICNFPVMLVSTSRPETRPRWSGFPHSTVLTLGRLSRAQAVAIVAALTGGKDLPSSVLDQILSKTEGVPLFVEELTKVVLESGLLEERNGDLVLRGPLPPLAVPATLHDSLMARLDRLASVREVAQIGAVIGREFSHELLLAVTGLPWAELDRATHELFAAGLVFRRGAGGQATYAFKHALVQDVAYNSLLLSRRQQLHARIARALQEQFQEVATNEPELLAFHFSRAGLVEEAIAYNDLAGRRALSRSLITEALARFESALEGLAALPPSEDRLRRELGIHLALGSAHVAANGFAAPPTGAAYSRARELCEELADTRQLFPVLYGLSLYHLYAAELAKARAASERLLQLADASNDTGVLFFAHRAAGVTAFPAGEFTRARTHLEQALAVYDPREHRAPAFVYAFDPRVVCLDYLARSLLPLGFPDSALMANDDATAEAQKVGHRNSLALPLFFGGVIRQVLGDREGVQARAGELNRLATEAGFRFWQAGATILDAWSIASSGDVELGRDQLKRGVQEWRATGAEFMVPYFLSLEAQIESSAGRFSAALELLEEAYHLVERTNERWFEAEILRLTGQVLAQLGGHRSADASRFFSRAVETARAQGARFWELRALLALGIEGDSTAREQFRQLYETFTEGFALPELQSARGLLMETRTLAVG